MITIRLACVIQPNCRNPQMESKFKLIMSHVESVLLHTHFQNTFRIHLRSNRRYDKTDGARILLHDEIISRTIFSEFRMSEPRLMKYQVLPNPLISESSSQLHKHTSIQNSTEITRIYQYGESRCVQSLSRP